MRPLRALLALILAFPALAAGAQTTTTITATGQYWGGSPLAQGKLFFFGVTPSGKPQTFSSNGKIYPAPDITHLQGGFYGTIVNGALSGAMTVPDKASATAAFPLCYDQQLFNTATGQATDFGVRCDITGTTISADTYVPPVTAPIYVTGYTHGPAASMPAHCAVGALYGTDDTHVLMLCGTDSVFHTMPGSGGTAITSVTATGLAAGQSPTASLNNAVLALGIPAGATGAQGPTGAAGVSPTVSVLSTTTGAAGSSAAVAIDPSSTSSSVKLNFTIPQGAPGAGSSPAAPAAYVAGTTYTQYALATYNGAVYQSQQAANVGHQPDTNASWWLPYAAAAGQKNIANGVAGLDSDARVSLANLPIAVRKANIYGIYLLDDADYAGGTGTVLHDHSGLNNDCNIPTGTGAPTWVTVGNGKRALQWPMTNTTQVGIGCTGLVSPGSMQSVWLFGQANNNTTYNRTIYGYTVSPGPNMSEARNQVNALPKTLWTVNPAGSGTYGTLAPTGTGYNLHTLTLGTTDHIYFNDVEQFSALANPAAPIPTGGNLEIGTSHGSLANGTNTMYNATMTFLVVYSDQLTGAAEQQNYRAIRDYHNQFGVFLGVPTPFNTTPVPYNFVSCCTSIEAGTGSNVSPSSLMSLGASFAINNSAIPSVTFSEKQAGGFALEKTFLNPYADNFIILENPPTNDFCSNTNALLTPVTSAAQAWSLVAKGIQDLKNAGFQQVGVSTMMSRAGNGAGSLSGTTCDSFAQQFNALARSYTVAAGGFLFDLAADPVWGAVGAYSGANYTSDHIHPTGAGAQLIANREQSVILANFGGYNKDNPNTQTDTYTMTSADRYLIANISAAKTFTFHDVTSLTGYEYTIVNPSAFALTMTTQNSQTISGSATVAPGTTAVFRVMLTSPTTGGNYLLRER